MSTPFSRHENYFSLPLSRVDAIGKGLLQRVNELLATRPDLGRDDLGRAIRRGKPWISEFFSGKRTTNDLRLVFKMARFFGVPIDFLLRDDARVVREDAQTVTLLGAWNDLDTDHRETVLQLALRLRQRPQQSDN